MRIALITVPYTSTGQTVGEARAPRALRDAGLLRILHHAGHDVLDFGDVNFARDKQSTDRDPASGIIAPETLTEMVLAVRDAVSRALIDERFPIVIGGECPLLLGCLAAMRDLFGPPQLLFVDGHEDAWPPHASTTGEAADMELGLALGLTHAEGLDDLNAVLPILGPEDVVILGPRDRQEIEHDGVRSLADHDDIAFFTDADVRRQAPDEIDQTWSGRLGASGKKWWFHLDLDVLSTEALSAVRYPQPGGLDWVDLERLTNAALQHPRLAGWNLTIYNPDLDPSRVGAARIMEFIEITVEQLARRG